MSDYPKSLRQKVFSFTSYQAKGGRDERVRTRPWLVLSSGISWVDFMRYTATKKYSLGFWYGGLFAGVLCELLAGLIPSWWLTGAAVLCWAAAVAVLVGAVQRSSSTRPTLELRPDPGFYEATIVLDRGETTRVAVALPPPRPAAEARPLRWLGALWSAAYLSVAAGVVCLLLAPPARSWSLVAAAAASWAVALVLGQLGRLAVKKRDEKTSTDEKDRLGRGTVTWSTAHWDRDLLAQMWALDRLDQEQQPALEWNPARWRPSDRLDEYRKQVMLSSYTKARPFNGPVASQMSDVTAESLAASKPVRMREARYFDLMCTNYLADKTLTWTDESHEPSRGVDLIRQPCCNALRDIADNGLADIVGVSTIAIDADFRTILISQSKDSLSSADLLAPSGSGSLEPRDHRAVRRVLKRADKPDRPSAFEMLKTGMNRELVEEANIDASWIEESYLVGYYRWLDKGAKPEYLGVTIIGRGSEDLRKRQRAVESKWVKGVWPGASLDLRSLMLWPFEPRATISHQELEDMADNLSVPLAMGLTMMGLRMRSEKHSPQPGSLYNRLRPALPKLFAGVEEILPDDGAGSEWVGRLEPTEDATGFNDLRPSDGDTLRRDPESDAVAVVRADGSVLARIPPKLPEEATLKEVVLGADTVWVRSANGPVHPAPQEPGHGVDWGRHAGVGVANLAGLVTRLLGDSQPSSAGLEKVLASVRRPGTVLTRDELVAARDDRPR